jgi:hypothetical protein
MQNDITTRLRLIMCERCALGVSDAAVVAIGLLDDKLDIAR